MERIGTLESVWRYPVKSMAGEEVARAFVGFPGLLGDRVHAFVREPGPSGFPWLTGREQASLILYRPRFVEPAASALPRDIEKSMDLGPGVVPVYPDQAALAVVVTTPAGRTLPLDSADLKAEIEAASGQRVSLRSGERCLADCRPVSLLGNASVEALGERLGQAMDRRRFRANLHVDWADGAPFREDELVGRTLQVGDRLRLAILERDPRCQMITLDPDTGAATAAILQHLTKARGGTLGVYAAVLAEGIAAAGDPIHLL